MVLILTAAAINQIVLDQSKKRIEILYYNIYQGNVEEKYLFSEITLNIETTYKEVYVKQITFYIKRRADIIIKKVKMILAAAICKALKKYFTTLHRQKNNHLSFS